MLSTVAALLGEFPPGREPGSRVPGSATSHYSCLPGLCLCQRISAQKQTLSKPIIWAKPGSVIPKGMAVIIWCEGTFGAVEYQLHFDGLLSSFERPTPPGITNKVKFAIRLMTQRSAGQYRCFYREGELWSEPSDPLDLVVTGMYDTPTLSVHPGSKVIPGENVTFHCHLETGTSTFFLLKEGRLSSPQRRNGKFQAEFPMGPVTTAHSGTYRCFGSYNDFMWSFPSETVVLLVTGDVGDTNLAPTGQPSSDAWEPSLFTTEVVGFQEGRVIWDHRADTLLRVGLIFLVLVALVCLLAEDWLRGKTTEEIANGASKQECRVRFRTQRALDKGRRDAVAIGKAEL
ncbi:natural cytotoxicity triggering receptor 1-like isoform X1 [Phyllostomus hastatus]|uniref:natural cytotoxicity triggering receptor 1-like isoform X1 n=1 Tax=Phyllostomus hastatus TaxID=9423 RepID=UPI001E68189C|nr:natural cytotoxicity triggering receptor 1-like isoform X1 [Phyllostomus hastatus]